MGSHHRHNHPRRDQDRQAREDHGAPFDANKKTVATVAATMDLGLHERQHDAFPQFSPTPFDVVGLTAGTLQRQQHSVRFRHSSE
jgi:hypothetical protein